MPNCTQDGAPKITQQLIDKQEASWSKTCMNMLQRLVNVLGQIECVLTEQYVDLSNNTLRWRAVYVPYLRKVNFVLCLWLD